MLVEVLDYPIHDGFSQLLLFALHLCRELEVILLYARYEGDQVGENQDVSLVVVEGLAQQPFLKTVVGCRHEVGLLAVEKSCEATNAHRFGLRILENSHCIPV